MPAYDFECIACKQISEDIVPSGTDVIPCPVCGASATKVFIVCPKQMKTIVPIYRGCKKHKAGYQHTHADRPATKVLGKGWSPDN